MPACTAARPCAIRAGRQRRASSATKKTPVWRQVPAGTGWGDQDESPMGGAVVFQSGLAEQTGSQPICGSLVVERNFSAAVAPWHTSVMMRLRRPVLAAALATLASPCFAESSAPIPVNNPPAQNAFIDLLALMSGHCK